MERKVICHANVRMPTLPEEEEVEVVREKVSKWLRLHPHAAAHLFKIAFDVSFP